LFEALLFCLGGKPEKLLASSYTNPPSFHNRKWGFAQQSGGLALRFRYTSPQGWGAGKTVPKMLEFELPRLKK